MKFLYFDHPELGDWRLGVLAGEGVVDVTDAVSHLPHLDRRGLMNAVIADFDGVREAIERAAGAGTPISPVTVSLRPPLPLPRQIDCMAVNYMEDGTLPEPPLINGFHKSPSAIIGTGGTMVLPDVPADVFEGDLDHAAAQTVELGGERFLGHGALRNLGPLPSVWADGSRRVVDVTWVTARRTTTNASVPALFQKGP